MKTYYYYHHDASDTVFKSIVRLSAASMMRDDIIEIDLERYIDLSIELDDNHEDTLI